MKIDAAIIFGKMGDKQVIKALIRALKDKYGPVQLSAEQSLIEIGEPTLEFLIVASKDKDWTIRAKVVKILGEIKNEEGGIIEEDGKIIKVLLEMTKDENMEVRIMAVTTLTKKLEMM